jgi:hypothetical protein
MKADRLTQRIAADVLLLLFILNPVIILVATKLIIFYQTAKK